MKQSMSDFKFNGCRENSEFYVSETLRLYSDAITRFNPDALVPVPVHISRKRLRGYNQAEVIAAGISGKTGIPMLNDLLYRRKKTVAQKVLNSEKRLENLKEAFTCDEAPYSYEDINIRFGRVLLVDDIYTTGSTMEGCTLALKKAGVREVGILSIASGFGY